jgi:ribosomal protein L25 (general stress protein Ctc)
VLVGKVFSRAIRRNSLIFSSIYGGGGMGICKKIKK